jgi:hypothetical protein
VNVTVPPGTYTVIDTDRNTWSQNALSSGAGFVRVTGTAPTAACAPAGPARRGVPYGGNCRGCDHPDLTAYGGNGPFASGTNVSLHRPVSQPPAKFIASLSPTTAVSSYEQQCTAQGGTLTLVDDEPWYYYFIGFYARFACM